MYCTFRTNIPEEDLDVILDKIRLEISLPEAIASESSPQKKDESDTAAPTPVAGIQSNRLRNLQKKLDQIEALKERQKKGEKLEANQVGDGGGFKLVISVLLSKHVDFDKYGQLTLYRSYIQFLNCSVVIESYSLISFHAMLKLEEDSYWELYRFLSCSFSL